jgi:16S rRNA (uracil1498-N3)-methyltransferase
MMMNRFFFLEVIQADQVSFPGNFRTRSLRCAESRRPGHGAGQCWYEYKVELITIDGREVTAVREQRLPAESLPSELYLCLTQREKSEFALQKCTETGAAAFMPVISSRSRVRIQLAATKSQNAGSALSASSRAIRGRLPVIPAFVSRRGAGDGAQTNARNLLAWEMEDALGLTQPWASQCGRPLGFADWPGRWLARLRCRLPVSTAGRCSAWGGASCVWKRRQSLRLPA